MGWEGVGMVKVKGKECLGGEWGWEGEDSGGHTEWKALPAHTKVYSSNLSPPPTPPPLPSPANVLPGRTHKGCMVTTLYVVTSY